MLASDKTQTLKNSYSPVHTHHQLQRALTPFPSGLAEKSQLGSPFLPSFKVWLLTKHKAQLNTLITHCSVYMKRKWMLHKPAI